MEKKIFTGLVVAAFLYIVYPLLIPVAMGSILAVLFYPWLVYLKRKGIPGPFASGMITLLITLVLILPASLLIFFAAKSAFAELQSFTPTSGQGFFDLILEQPGVHSFLVWVTSIVPVNIHELAESLQELSGRMGGRLTELAGSLLTHVPGIFMSLALVVVSIYFLLLDGPDAVLYLRKASVFSKKQTDELLEAIAGMCRSVIMASVVSGGMQATLEILACLIGDIPHLALIGLMVFVSSFLPVIGSAPITCGIAIQQLLLGRKGIAIFLFVAAGIIATADNLVRPLFLKGSTGLHPLVAFIAAFGGIQTLGFLGVFLGPIVAALCLVTFRIVTRSPANVPLTPGTLKET